MGDEYNGAALPIYFVCDVSGSMETIGGIDQINGMILELHRYIASDPIISDRIRFGIIEFSDTANELLQISKMIDLVSMPGLLPAEGLSNYGEAFNLLRVVIARDIANLKSLGLRVYRPAVFFITDGEPTDDWVSNHRALTDKTKNPNAPNLFAIGVEGSNPAIIGNLSSGKPIFIRSSNEIGDFMKAFAAELFNAHVPISGTRRSFDRVFVGENYVLPFYCIFDQSEAVDEKAYLDIQSSINLIVDSISTENLPYSIEFSLVSFAETMQVRKQLSKVSDLKIDFPKLTSKKSDFVELFAKLRELMIFDNAQIRNSGNRSINPLLLIITASNPTNSNWETPYKRFRQSISPDYLQIVTLGIGNAKASFLSDIATEIQGHKAAFRLNENTHLQQLLGEILHSY